MVISWTLKHGPLDLQTKYSYVKPLMVAVGAGVSINALIDVVGYPIRVSGRSMQVNSSDSLGNSQERNVAAVVLDGCLCRGLYVGDVASKMRRQLQPFLMLTALCFHIGLASWILQLTANQVAVDCKKVYDANCKHPVAFPYEFSH